MGLTIHCDLRMHHITTTPEAPVCVSSVQGA